MDSLRQREVLSRIEHVALAQRWLLCHGWQRWRFFWHGNDVCFFLHV